MFNSIKVSATRLFNHYVDWTRIAELIRSGAHRYTLLQLIPRVFILAATGYSSYVCSKPQQAQQLGSSRINGALIGAGIGFFISHAVVIAPLIYKRWKMSQQCLIHKKSILGKLKHLEYSFTLSRDTADKYIELIKKLIDKIMNEDQSTARRGNASKTWGVRKRKLAQLDKALINLAHKNEHNILLILDKFNPAPTKAIDHKVKVF